MASLSRNSNASLHASFSDFVVNKVVEGTVTDITSFGVFVDLGGISGLIPNREVAWDYVRDANSYVHLGDRVRVVVINTDSDKKRITLSLKQLSPKPKQVERDMSKVVEENSFETQDVGDAEVIGDLYLRFLSDDGEDELSRRVVRLAESHAQSLHVDETDDVYDQVASVLFQEGVSHTYYVSNVSTRPPRNCRDTNCPFGEGEEASNCVLARQCCSVVMLRPACDTPRMEAMFPGDEVLGIQAFVQHCPHKENGAVLGVMGLSWMPKCDRRPYEIRLSGRMVWSSTRLFDSRPGNAFNAKLLERLSPISVITQRNLSSWRDYLTWRNRLLLAKKIGIRFISRRFDPASRVVVFTVIGDPETRQFWRREAVFVAQMKDSIETWQYKEDQAEESRKHRNWPVPLGDFDKETLHAEFDRKALGDAGCPWKDPYVADLSFSLGEDVLEKIDAAFDDAANEEDIRKYLEDEFPLPETGFLTVSSMGDESLIRRQQRALDGFAESGSADAPFLTSYLFDITKARVPGGVPPVVEFLNKGLNEAQKQAVVTMVTAPDVALIQGPPGTGKTTVIAEAIWQFVKLGKRVLLVSQSGAAVDNALDRLANIPAIRAIRLKKETRYSHNGDEGGRYAMDSVLQNFYVALARGAKDQLEAWKGAEERIKLLDRVKTNLDNLLDRLSREEAVLSDLRKMKAELNTGLQQVQLELSRQRSLAIARQLTVGFVDYLNGVDFPQALSDAGDAIPHEIVVGFENVLLKNLESLSILGVQLFVPAYNRNWLDAQKIFSIKNSLEQLKILQQEVMPACKADLQRLNGLVGEAVVSDVVALELEELQRKRDEIERQEENETDDDRLDVLSRKRREIQRKISALKKESCFSAEIYRRVFNVPNEESVNVADWLSKPGRGRSEIVRFLEKLIARVERYLQVVDVAKQKLAEKLSTSPENGDNLEELEKKVSSCRRKLLDNAEQIAQGENRCVPVHEKLSRELSELALRTGGKFENGEQAREWCTKESARQREVLSATVTERQWRQPLLEEWVERLGTVEKSDEEYVIDDYLDSCSVVGMTCTSDNRLLEDRGYDHFDVVIIDEVSKATPPELLMSMAKAEKTILVGDHRQLPPLFGDREPKALEEIVNEQEEANVSENLRITKESFRKYQSMVEASLFKQHFEQADDRLKSMLWYQYRMHPDIMRLVNVFYENRLECGIDNPDEARNHLQSPEHVPWMKNPGHVFWIDSSTDPSGEPFEEVLPVGSTSIENPLEVKLIVKALVDLDNGLEAHAKSLPPDLAKKLVKTVGVIAFYARQKGALVKELRQRHFKHLKCRIDTVDRFQGQERDYILVSLTRNKIQSRSVRRRASSAYVAKFERINVAFSRARELLLIFGARDTFVDYPVSLPPLDRAGKPVEDLVYRKMIDLLNREGRLLGSRDLIAPEEWKAINPQIARPQTKFHPRSFDKRHDRGPGHFGRGTGRKSKSYY